ncbi:MAG: lipid A-modifier LpxR family protein, partial [Rhizomicrobium sp.]
QGRAVARNLFLDGNSFGTSRSVEKEIFVGEVSFGGALDLEQFRLSFVHVIRSREYRTQSGFDQFGTLSLAVKL